MQLTHSDLCAINPSLIPKPEKKRVRGKDIEWSELAEKYEGKTAKEINKETGLSLVAIYKAANRGDINISKRYQREWPSIAKYSEQYTVRGLARKTGISPHTLRAAVSRGYIKCKKDTPRKHGPNGRFIKD